MRTCCSVELRIQTQTEPVPLKYGKLATKYPWWDIRIFLQCIVRVIDRAAAVITADVSDTTRNTIRVLSFYHALNRCRRIHPKSTTLYEKRAKH